MRFSQLIKEDMLRLEFWSESTIPRIIFLSLCNASMAPTIFPTIFLVVSWSKLLFFLKWKNNDPPA